MKNIHYYIICIALLVGMASCSSSRRVAVDAPGAASVWKTGESVVARANLKFQDSNGKGTSVGGTLRMKRDDVVQLNATYILGIQIGTLEMTRDSVLVVSRATRQYAVFGYQELSSLIGRSITFNDVQNIFWGEAEEFRVKGVDWKYGSFLEMADKRRLPGDLELRFVKGSQFVDVAMTFSSHKYEEGWSLRTKVNASNYSSLSVEQAVKIISLLIGG